MPTLAAALAAHRFGLGARPGELARLPDDPREALLAQLATDTPPAPLAALPSSEQRTREVVGLLQARRDDGGGLREALRDIALSEARARTTTRLTSETPFRERWVAFWSNHLAVSGLRVEALGLVGAYERAAIRRHVTGRFEDLLLAATRHPAMLLYLDNARSIGPDSPAGRRLNRGLNENLARELLELHTLGVDGGYSQADVTALAGLLTGWTVVDDDRQAPGGFVYAPTRHQPGRFTVVGVEYGPGGAEEGERALRDLARHPSTLRHLCRKLARHFIADDPPADAVLALEAAWEDTHGDLGALARALVHLDSGWQMPLSKLRSPDDFVTALGRALATDRVDAILRYARDLGQPPWTPPSPQGWPDTAEAWGAPGAVLARVQTARDAAERVMWRLEDPDGLTSDVLGPLLSAETRDAIAHAPDRLTAIGLLLASPELQRR